MIVNIIGDFISFIGFIFLFLSILGLFKIKDPMTKIHAASVSDSLGVPLILIGMILKSGLSTFSLKLAVLLIISIIISPTIGHNIARLSYRLTKQIKKNDSF